MQLICQHDPADPNHLICETKHSPFYNWLRARWQQFYCSGPKCPPHKAYTHLVIDILLLLIVLGLLLTAIIFALSYRRVEEEQVTLENKLTELKVITAEAVRQEEEEVKTELSTSVISFSLTAEALYFSVSGEQLGRGPWPPQIGETTKLKVVFNPKLSLEAFSDVEVSGVLTKYAQWTGFAPLGRGLVYEPAERTVRWDVRCQVSGVRCENSAVFEVAVTPPAQVFKDDILVIMQEVKMRGREIATNRIREIEAPDVILVFSESP